MADALKAAGNAAFSAGDYDAAIAKFTEAIALDGSNHVFYSNRSACYASLGKFEEALEDGQSCVNIKPDWAKGYARKGAALHGLKRYNDALAAYEAGLAIDADSAMLKSGLEEVKRAKEGPSFGGGAGGLGGLFSSPDIWGKLATNPQTRDLLQQPDFVAKLQAIQQNPAAAEQHLNDPRIMQALGVAMGANVMSGDQFRDSMGSDPEAAAAAEAKRKEEAEKRKEAEEQASKRKAEEEAAAAEAALSPDQKAKRARAEEAEAIKAEGNALYKSKQFDEALEKYAKAYETDNENITYLNNTAAVYYEMGNFEKCRETCDAAVERGRELRADYKLVAKAFARKGNAFKAENKLEDAVECYQKSLTEHRTADTLKRLNDTEKAIKTRDETAYLDDDKAEEARQLGNDAFKRQDYPEAVKHYTESIKRNPKDHRVYSNRAASYTKLTALTEALKDAEKCIELDPTFAKGYTRKATVQFFMKEYSKAMATYEALLKVDPQNAEAQDGLRRCVDAINRGNRGEMSEAEMKERQEKAMADPEIQGILQDPIMRQVLNDFQTNPKAAAEHQRNPGVMAKIQKLVAAGIVQMR
eukprot:PRCOL_00006826-RA